MAFLAEEAGATQVTLLDAMPPTEEFQAELDARGSKVRFVLADLYDAATPELIGKHDVVWCTGLMYHAPSPFLAMERLWAMTGELLILGNKVVPETPGLSQAAILYPGISGWQRRIHERFGGGGVRAPFEPDPIRSYANWWWGLSPSACRALVGEPRIVESASYPLRTTHDHYVLVARAN